ncbi:hypothetical protein DTO021D3_3083 [Paecilomyces variotii]|nr:hypothetical protein DTO032I3_7469 [Paecilomyces variotii]KAJ9280166.1 hypothetical protein DTO021D3_3083 [Paecilomyces variotii]KAJ9309366.1 hypothetical protein DTO217A2_984 [Paecilomyces variotii]KAJ9342441.1 hypothetical protein DTO027B6_4959 [Paecilomyces variotii]KAJ9382865.1 hypothetical protein DTO032I4_5513 [Paecilomyces variotii]
MNLDIVSRQDYAVPTYRETDGDHHVTARVVDMAARDLFGAKPTSIALSRPEIVSVTFDFLECEILIRQPHASERRNPAKMSLTNCRFYEEKYPEVDSYVMVNVKQIAEMGAYVKLLEYDNIDGMILLSELSRRRIRSIQKLIRIGRNEVVVVLRVDKEKGYIDLSKRRVSAEDVVKCEERYNKSKAVHSIMRHVAEKTKTPLETLYQTIGWPLNRKYGHAHDAFKLAITNPDVWNDVEEFPSQVVKDELLQYISKKLTPHPTKVRADVEVTCFGYEGIDAVKEALRTAEANNTPENQVKVKLVSPPLYVLTSQCLDKNLGIQLLEEAIKNMETKIKASGGACIVKMAPKAVTEHDDAELQALMDKRERENMEVSGDESMSESDEGVPE